MATEETPFYRDRPEWKDVEPVLQDDGPAPVVAIAYQDKFIDVFNYFRAVLKSGEKSERALELTRDAIYLNAANYTVWEFRRHILTALKKDLQEEMEFTAYVIDLHPKNYQVWHHRSVLVEMLNDASQEKALTAHAFAEDAKNYHGWQHRLWAVRTFGMYEGELEFTQDILRADIRNNSVWNYRYSIIQDTTKFDPETVELEIKFVLDKIKQAVNNESAWNYLKGVMFQKPGGLAASELVDTFCWNLYNKGNRSPYLLATMVEILGEKLKGARDKGQLDEALKICTELAEKEDTIRAEYWNYVKRRYASKFA